MFFKARGKPAKFKKAVYLVATIILGVLLSFLAHAFIEIKYLDWALGQGVAVPFYLGCALPPALSLELLLFGIVGGFFLGRFWWRLVYVERVWAKRYAKK